MIQFLIFIFATVGVTMIVTQGEIFRPLREFIKGKSAWFGKLIECPMCFGVYSGWAVQALILWSTGAQFHVFHILYGFIGSACSYCIIVSINTVEELCGYISQKKKIEEINF